jgi:dynein heavy chain
MAMISPEGEWVQLGKGLKARGNVENWLSKVEASMFQSLKRNMLEAIDEYPKKGRQAIIWNYPSQVFVLILLISCQFLSYE